MNISTIISASIFCFIYSVVHFLQKIQLNLQNIWYILVRSRSISFSLRNYNQREIIVIPTHLKRKQIIDILIFADIVTIGFFSAFIYDICFFFNCFILGYSPSKMSSLLYIAVIIFGGIFISLKNKFENNVRLVIHNARKLCSSNIYKKLQYMSLGLFLLLLPLIFLVIVTLLLNYT